MSFTVSPRVRARRLSLAAALLVTAVMLAGCSSGSATPTVPDFAGQHVDAATFAAAVAAPGVTVVDVRTPAEFAQGHLPGAINVDVSAPTFVQELAALDPTANYAVYCQSGNRSRAAMETMTAAGFTRTVGLDGGISAWRGDIVTN
jgi:rhodanese-related sulfurtransferase